ncbi:hypothetical protein VTL71DRAFT_11851 [Oculimacula yallundae]|uniref:Uncharacterized protein n=1 Tax=Oculimacula yallundae TaxID=86028 RepID=A0ABR4CRW5_9HELO
MDTTRVPFRPFSFNPDESPSTGTMESIAPSVDQPTPRFAASYEIRDKPIVPNRNPRRSQLWNDSSTPTRETGIPETPESSSQITGSSKPQRTPPPRSPTFQTPPRSPALQTPPSPRSPAFQMPPAPRSPAFQSPPSPRSAAFRLQSSSPTPPMTKSSKKILQLTGFDPRFERALPLDHQQLSPTHPARPPISHSPIRSISSNSSGSFYSQAEAGFEYEQAGSIKDSKASVAQSSHDEGELLTSSIYNISEHGSKSSNVSKTNIKRKLKDEQALPRPSVEIIPQAQSQPKEEEEAEEASNSPPQVPASLPIPRPSNEITSLPEILAQENLRYSNGFEKDTASSYKHSIPTTPSLIPPPLTIQPKPSNPFPYTPTSTSPNPKPRTKERTKPQHITLPSKPRKQSLFRSAKDTLEWGIYDSGSSSNATSSRSPSKSKHLTTPVSPMFSMASDHLSLSPPLGSSSSPAPQSPLTPKSRRIRFGSTSKHPLKSPFPFPLPFRSQTSTSTPQVRDISDSSGPIAEVDEDEEAADTMPSPSTARSFTRRISSTLKNLSPTSPSSPSSPSTKTGKKGKRSHPPSSKKFVITNAARRADGPATPMPLKSPFLEGVMRGKEALGRVGKSVVGTGTGLSKEEKREVRRRESLKKRIVVVGITDQSPDGRVSEWL